MSDIEPPEHAEDPRNAERLKFFTDAVVAIALTLLVLPLLESVTEALHEHLGPAAWIERSLPLLIAFVVSFAVEATFWVLHHGIYTHVRRFTPALLWLNMAWMMTIVFLQVPSAMMFAVPPDRVIVGLYIGTATASAALLMAMARHVAAHPDIQVLGYSMSSRDTAASMAMALLYGAALVVALLFPSINYYALFLLMLVAPVRRLVVARLA